ncbi:hypothetical protein [Clostridium sp.]|uniref:hypothetical protein n=1 Tax=Clostridium sp. TaxID=1506 RepID=UPI0032170CD8
MNLEYLRDIDSITREKIMREELGEEKCKILDKFNLHPNEKLYWQRVEDKYPTQEYFSHKLAMKSSTIGIIFHINRLCYAKTKYFEKNWDKFVPCIYEYTDKFVETEIYNMEYIKQKSTGIIIDLRELAKIHWIDDFRAICDYLEASEEETISTLKKEIC